MQAGDAHTRSSLALRPRASLFERGFFAFVEFRSSQFSTAVEDNVGSAVRTRKWG